VVELDIMYSQHQIEVSRASAKATSTMAPKRVMEYTNLGRSGLKVSKIILGAMSYGSSDWQPWVLNEEEALPLLKHAYDVGINTWDTVRLFGPNLAERWF
jgi:Aldo/keto reductase family